MVITLTVEQIIVKSTETRDDSRIQLNFSLGNNNFDSNMYKMPDGKNE